MKHTKNVLFTTILISSCGTKPTQESKPKHNLSSVTLEDIAITETNPENIERKILKVGEHSISFSKIPEGSIFLKNKDLLENKKALQSEIQQQKDVMINDIEENIDSFWASSFVVTQGLVETISPFEVFKPYTFLEVGKNLPAHNLDTSTIDMFISDFNEHLQNSGVNAKVRLPSAKEWIRFSGIGSQSLYPWGSQKEDGTDFEWFREESGKNLQEVGQKSPNSFGLYDTIGNCLEMVSDVIQKPYWDERLEDSYHIPHRMIMGQGHTSPEVDLGIFETRLYRDFDNDTHDASRDLIKETGFRLILELNSPK